MRQIFQYQELCADQPSLTTSAAIEALLYQQDYTWLAWGSSPPPDLDLRISKIAYGIKLSFNVDLVSEGLQRS